MAADKDITKSMEKELSCTLCIDLYKNPVMLPCLHSFCYTCLEDFLKAKPSVKNILRCPICRIGVELTSTGLNTLQKNFQLASIVDIYRQIRGESNTMNRLSKHVPVQQPEVENDEDDTAEMPPILPLPSNIIDGHLAQPNSFYIDSDAESSDDDEVWNEEFRALNQDFNFLWIGTLSDLQHIRLPMWNPSSSNDATDNNTTDNPPARSNIEISSPLPLPTSRRNALIRNFASNNLQGGSSSHSGSVLNTQSEHISRVQPTRKRSKIVNFFRKHFTR